MYYGARVLSWMKHLKGASDWHLVQFTGGWISGNSLQKIRRLRGLIPPWLDQWETWMGELTNEKTAVNFVRLINFLDQLVTLTQFAQYLKNSS